MGFLDRFRSGATTPIDDVVAAMQLDRGLAKRLTSYLIDGGDPAVLGQLPSSLALGEADRQALYGALRALTGSPQFTRDVAPRLVDLWLAQGWSMVPLNLTLSERRAIGYVDLARNAQRAHVDAMEILAVLEPTGVHRDEAAHSVVTALWQQRRFNPDERPVQITGLDPVLGGSPAVFAHLLGSADPATRTAALQLLAGVPQCIPQHRARVEELTRDGVGEVQQAALAVVGGAVAATATAPTPAPAPVPAPAPAPTRAIADGDPVPPPYTPLPVASLGEPFVSALVQAIQERRASLEERAKRFPQQTFYAREIRELDELTPEVLRRVEAALSGVGPVWQWLPDAVRLRPIARVAGQHPGFTLRHAIRFAIAEQFYFTGSNAVPKQIETDLRAVMDCVIEAEGPSESRPHRQRSIDLEDVSLRLASHIRDNDLVWPYFAEHPEVIDGRFGLLEERSARGPHDSQTALELLYRFPRIPQHLLPKVESLAVGGVQLRESAQRLIARQPEAHEGLPVALANLEASAEVSRANAASWLVDVVANTHESSRDEVRHASLTALEQALAGERRPLAQSAMLVALRALGRDLAEFLTPQSLLADAHAGLRRKVPAGMAWFPLDSLPELRWVDGSPVDPTIIRWWAVLAVTLKDPAGEGLISQYVQLLDRESQRTLGSFVLASWTAHDLVVMSEDVIAAAATKDAPLRYAGAQRALSRTENEWTRKRASMTVAEHGAEIRREMQGTLTGSAIKEKGLLALAIGAPGHELPELISRYAKRYPARRAQIEAFVTTAAMSEDPAALQAVIAVARRFKQRSVRARAAELVEEIAQRRGWSTEELADRTIPTAGFPARGETEGEDEGESDSTVAILDFGARQFTMRVTPELTLALATSDGKPLKALPAPGVKDDPELAKEAKSSFTAAKRELSQVVALQSARLHEAMCLERTWSAEAWRSSFAAHPTMRHLIAQLVWEALPAGEGAPPELFGATTPAIAADQREFTDREGWVLTLNALRSALKRRGFQFGSAEDGGWIDSAAKDVGPWTVRLHFTGTYPGQEGTARVALRSLTVVTNGRWVAMTEVPPVLLAETYADYHAVAAAGAFDPEWGALA